MRVSQLQALFLFLSEFCPLVDFPLLSVLKWIQDVSKEASPRLLEKAKVASEAKDNLELFDGTRLSSASALLAMLLSCHAIDFPSFVQQFIGTLQESCNQALERSTEDKEVCIEGGGKRLLAVVTYVHFRSGLKSSSRRKRRKIKG